MNTEQRIRASTYLVCLQLHQHPASYNCRSALRKALEYEGALKERQQKQERAKQDYEQAQRRLEVRIMKARKLMAIRDNLKGWVPLVYAIPHVLDL